MRSCVLHLIWKSVHSGICAMIHISILQGPILNSGAIVNLLLRLQRLIRFPLFPLLIGGSANTGILLDVSPIMHRTRPPRHIYAFTTMHGHQRRRGTCDPEPLMITRTTSVLLRARAVRRGAPRISRHWPLWLAISWNVSVPTDLSWNC